MINLSLLFVMLLTPFAAGADSDRAPSAERLEARILGLVNEYRASMDLGELTLDSGLTKQAREHSKRMATGKVDFGHDGFEDRIENAGIKIASAAENVGMNLGKDDPASAAVQAWLNSSGHRTNIEGRYNLTGIGAARARDGSWFFTQLFVSSRARSSDRRR